MKNERDQAGLHQTERQLKATPSPRMDTTSPEGNAQSDSRPWSPAQTSPPGGVLKLQGVACCAARPDEPVSASTGRIGWPELIHAATRNRLLEDEQQAPLGVESTAQPVCRSRQFRCETVCPFGHSSGKGLNLTLSSARGI